jgi:hypothetical protein
VEVEEVEGQLNKRSGLLGVSGVSRDMRVPEKVPNGSPVIGPETREIRQQRRTACEPSAAGS